MKNEKSVKTRQRRGTMKRFTVKNAGEEKKETGGIDNHRGSKVQARNRAESKQPKSGGRERRNCLRVGGGGALLLGRRGGVNARQ